MKKNFLIQPFAFLMLITLSMNTAFAQRNERVRGNGNIKSEERNISSFNSVDCGGSYHIYIRQGNQTTLKIETDANLLPYIITEVHGNKLEIKNKEHTNINPSKEIDIYLTVNELKKIAISGSSKIESRNTISGNDLTIDISGSADINMDIKMNELKTKMSGSSKMKLNGSASSASYSVSGSADVKADDMATDDTQINVSGNAKLSIYAQKKLNIKISGMGDVRYKGNPTVTQDISGRGHIRSE